MELIRYWRALRRRLWLLAALAVLAAAVAGLYSEGQPKVYQATTVAVVNPTQLFAPAAQSSTGYQPPSIDQLVQTYETLISSLPVDRQLIADGVPRSADELQKHTTVTRRPGTTAIEIAYRDDDARVAGQVASLIIPAFNSSLDDLQAKVQVSGSATRLQGLVAWQVPDAIPSTPVSPNIALNVGLAAVGGLLTALALVLASTLLDHTIQSEQDVRNHLEIPVLGSISLWHPRGRRAVAERAVALTTLTRPTEQAAEAFRAVRTALLFNAEDTARMGTVVVTSSVPGEGKTTCACNLAIALAQAGREVILIDADFRRPSIYRIFQKPPEVGLGNLFLGDRSVDDVLAPTDLATLHVLCTGPTPPNPSEVLGSPGLVAILQRLGEVCDVIIMDTPPVNAVTDATVLAALSDGVVLVVEGGRTPVKAVKRAQDTLDQVGARVLGVILNKVRTTDDAYYYDYYGKRPERGDPVVDVAAPPRSSRHTQAPAVLDSGKEG